MPYESISHLKSPQAGLLPFGYNIPNEAIRQHSETATAPMLLGAIVQNAGETDF